MPFNSIYREFKDYENSGLVSDAVQCSHWIQPSILNLDKGIIKEKGVHDETLFEVNYITYFRTNLLHHNRDLTSLSDMKRR